MKITKISLRNFRNIEEAELTQLSDFNVLTGANGQGKTNILEGIGVLLTGSSFRSRADGDLIQEGKGESRLMAVVQRKDITSVISVELRLENGKAVKEIKVDDKKTSAGALLAQWPVVLFAPEEVDLIRDESMRRRRVIDGLGVRVNEEYRLGLAEYVRIWRHRNQLLLAVKQQRASEDDLDVWDERMAEVGSRLVGLRKVLVETLAKEAASKYKSFGVSKGVALGLEYLPNIQASKAYEYLEILKSARIIDIARAHTTRGIHRDDLAILLGREDALKRASRGEFRSVVLSIKLAEGELLKERLGESPVYLLDDVWSELDSSRRAALKAELADNQMIMTTHEQVDELVPTFEVKAGEVLEKVRG